MLTIASNEHVLVLKVLPGCFSCVAFGRTSTSVYGGHTFLRYIPTVQFLPIQYLRYSISRNFVNVVNIKYGSI